MRGLKEFFKSLFFYDSGIDPIDPVNVNSYEFEAWAYGEPIPTLQKDRIECWNKLHGKKLKLNPKAKISKSLEAMTKIWIEENKDD